MTRGKPFMEISDPEIFLKTGFQPNIPDLDVREKLGTYSGTCYHDM